jgi:hypothetical protein
MELERWRKWWRARGEPGIRQLLMEEWDPLGVRGFPDARDEYDSYVPPIGRLLREGAGATDVAEYLTNIETERMGLSDTEAARTKAEEVAQKLIEWYAEEMADA